MLEVAEGIKDCECDQLDMSPERVSFCDRYTHMCQNCKGGITHEANSAYNQFWGFSGFDEEPETDSADGSIDFIETDR